MKIKITIGSTFWGVDEEYIEIDYNGTCEDFVQDDRASTEILNALADGEFPHYYLKYDYDYEEE